MRECIIMPLYGPTLWLFLECLANFMFFISLLFESFWIQWPQNLIKFKEERLLSISIRAGVQSRYCSEWLTPQTLPLAWRISVLNCSLSKV